MAWCCIYATFLSRETLCAILHKLNFNMFNRNWNRNHEEFWKSSLELNKDGLSYFQAELTEKIKKVLNSLSITFKEKITEHSDINNRDRIVKMITITFLENPKSKLWVYNDMAEYEINQIHHIFEEWGYLSPTELQKRFLTELNETLQKTK